MSKWSFTNRDDRDADELMSRQMQRIPATLPDFFTEQVMEQVRHTEMEAPTGTNLRKLSGMRRNRVIKKLQWGSAVAMGTAFMAFLLVASYSAYVRNSLQIVQTYTYSAPLPSLMFGENKPDFDIGLMEAQALGVVQQADVQATDKGYTLMLRDVVADPTRMVLSLQIVDEKGQPAEQAMDRFDFEQLHLKDQQGEDIGQLRGIMPMETRIGSDHSKQKYVMLIYIFPDKQPKDKVLIQSNVNELKTSKDGKKSLKGNWNFSYTADMEKANSLVVTSDLNESYTTPEGLHVKMDQLVHSPAGVQLKFTTSLSEAAAALTPMELRNKLTVMFHLENAKGQELSRINSYKDGGANNTSFTYIWKEEDGSSTLHWIYYFQSLPYDTMNIRFVLDGYTLPVKSNDSITFQPGELKQRPAIFDKQGDHLEIHNMKITETKDEPGVSGWMTVSGSFANQFSADQWVAYDQDGTEYKTVFRGAVSLEEQAVIRKESSDTSPSYFIAKGLTVLPKELTLVRTITDKRFTDVDWSFDLPKIERNEALKSISIP
ncbi:hypothetical protein A8L34_10760 [Bacillus sp. FJAT-27264]|uniref:DUF4179 domain-containing protein n=1 Tax=Paenibacillus sp. (strain DSM 101736 / FJAT-27264) TaxID=1850362 RepID=UPI000807CF45|nr:DUF4179 domain-containing protein [Bacillus sp. FJAT-27264]OBZ14413.1 hypothetical protein A8L34_10760 [Bacillus sp. FJAT-27264]